MTHFLKVISKNLPAKFYRETLHKPWMRLQIFLDDYPLSRTPEHYKKFIYDWKVATPTPVHYIPEKGNWKMREDGRIIPVQNFPLPLRYPNEMHDMLWGGEAVIKGFTKKIKRRRRVAHYWIPAIHETVVHSVILNKYMKVMVTPRALDMIDKHYGLDNYILETSLADLQTELALKLKREMLYTLLHKTMYPDDPVKRDDIYEKYKKFIIPEEELEWFGLSLREANRKQIKLEEKAKQIGPFKHIFRKELIQYLKEEAKEETEPASEESFKSSLLNKLGSLNIFSKRT